MWIDIITVFSIIAGAIIIDIPTASMIAIFYILGIYITSLIKSDKNKDEINIYRIAYLAGYFFILLSFIYMNSHNYEYLLGYDGIAVYMPNTEIYLNAGNYFSVLKQVWANYSFFDRNMPGYYTVLTFFGKIAQLINANLYVSLQLSTLFFAPFIGIVLYKIFLLLGIDQLSKKRYRYTLYILIFSVLFYFSTFIARDTHIALLYLIAIYLTFEKSYSLRNIIRLILVILITCTFRIESGLFLIIMIPVYLLLTLQKRSYKIEAIIASLVVFFVLASFVSNNMNRIQVTYKVNKENYVEVVAEESGMIANLQRIPIAGDIISIVYNASQPLPFWGKMAPSGKDNLGPEVYNIMNFPLAFASFFNWFVITYILFWILSSKLKKRTKGQISKPLKYSLFVGTIFLYIQSAVIAQRRLMGFYCVFYILFFIIYSNLRSNEKRQLNTLAIGSFITLQVLSAAYLKLK